MDILLHFFIGMFLTILLLNKKVSHIKVFAIVFLLALLKELFDSFSLTASVQESIKDILVTIAFPLLALITAFVKKKLDDA